MTHELDAHAETYDEHQRFYSENVLTERAYCRRIVCALQDRHDIRLLGLGLGHGVTARALNSALAGRLRAHVVLEGSRAMIARFKQQGPPPPALDVVECFFEDFRVDEPFDAIEMGFVLEHVENPVRLLRKYREVLSANGSIFIGVPNALSLHRRLGQMAGLLDDPYQLSDMDLKYGHRRYFDLESLTACLRNAGMRVHCAQGLFMKPFTERQLQSLDLNPQVWEALAEISKEYPAIANSIFIEAVL